jgi:predicted NUDIX family NTP pyrophosphohydrolase
LEGPEDLLDAAKKGDFEEETGFEIDGEFIALGELTQKNERLFMPGPLRKIWTKTKSLELCLITPFHS